MKGGYKLKGGLNLSGGINLILPQLTVDLKHFKPHYQSKHSEIGYDGDDREHIDEHSKDPHHCSLHGNQVLLSDCQCHNIGSLISNKNSFKQL